MNREKTEIEIAAQKMGLRLLWIKVRTDNEGDNWHKQPAFVDNSGLAIVINWGRSYSLGHLNSGYSIIGGFKTFWDALTALKSAKAKLPYWGFMNLDIFMSPNPQGKQIWYKLAVEELRRKFQPAKN